MNEQAQRTPSNAEEFKYDPKTSVSSATSVVKFPKNPRYSVHE